MAVDTTVTGCLDLTTTHLACLIEGLQSEWLLDRGIDMAAVVRALVEQLRAR